MATERENRELSTYVAWQSHVGVRTQIARLRESHAADQQNSGVELTDVFGLILALFRLRLAAQLTARIGDSGTRIEPELKKFDAEIPDVKKLRNVAMHFDEYALGTLNRRNKIGDPPRYVSTEDLWEVITDDQSATWLGVRLNYSEVDLAARNLYDAVQLENNSHLS